MIPGYQSEAHEKISGYLRGSASLAEVENWIWSFLGDLEDSQDEVARNVAGAIGSVISEYSYGDISEEALRAGVGSRHQAARERRRGESLINRASTPS